MFIDKFNYTEEQNVALTSQIEARNLELLEWL